MAVLLALHVTWRHPTRNAKQQEHRCHPLAADFIGHCRYTERCWTQSGGLCGAVGWFTLIEEGLGHGERLQALPVTASLVGEYIGER
jgi:hypothetical protein